MTIQSYRHRPYKCDLEDYRGWGWCALYVRSDKGIGRGTSVIGAFTTSGKWTYLAGDLTFSGSGTLGSATYTSGALLTGVVYRVEFVVWGISGDANISVSLLVYRDWETDRKSTRLNSSHSRASRMPSSA